MHHRAGGGVGGDAEQVVEVGLLRQRGLHDVGVAERVAVDLILDRADEAVQVATAQRQAGEVLPALGGAQPRLRVVGRAALEEDAGQRVAADLLVDRVHPRLAVLARVVDGGDAAVLRGALAQLVELLRLGVGEHALERRLRLGQLEGSVGVVDVVAEHLGDLVATDALGAEADARTVDAGRCSLGRDAVARVVHAPTGHRGGRLDAVLHLVADAGREVLHLRQDADLGHDAHLLVHHDADRPADAEQDRRLPHGVELGQQLGRDLEAGVAGLELPDGGQRLASRLDVAQGQHVGGLTGQ